MRSISGSRDDACVDGLRNVRDPIADTALLVEAYAMVSDRVMGKLSKRAILLCSLNGVCLVLYLYFAHWTWVLPGEEGLNTETSEPLIWNLGASPVLLVAFTIDVLWLISFLKLRPRWNELACTALVLALWIVAVTFDFSRHPH